eukprot:scaffold30390_cov137-Skeletonema_menzelii.AAC.2
MCVIGSPLDLVKSIFEPKQPEPKVKMAKPIKASVKEKRGWVATIVKFISRRVFRLVLLVLAILETLLETHFVDKDIVGCNTEERSWFWNKIFDEDEKYYDYEEVYGGEVQNDHPD